MDNFNSLWKLETDKGVKEIDNKHVQNGTFNSGIHKAEVGGYRIAKEYQRKIENRKRNLEVMSILPNWLAIVISIISLLVSLLRK